MMIRSTTATAFLLSILLLSAFSAYAQGQPDIFNVEVEADDADAGDLFSCAMSLSREETLVVGSVLDDNERGIDAGSLYIYRRQGGVFQQPVKKTADDGAPGHRLGFSVSVDPGGTRLVAGAIFHGAAGQNAGAAYVFRREGGSWIQEARLIPAALGAFDQLGHSVALSGNTLAAGAPGDDTRADAAGTVYVYRRVGTDWRLDAMLTANQGRNVGDGLGFAVALDGDTLLAGAPFADDGLGAVHVYQQTLEGWQQVQRITAPDRQVGALFGAAVALDGDRAVIGARLDDDIADRAGAAWVFRRVDGVWEAEQALHRPLPPPEPQRPDLMGGDEFGISVAIDGDAIAVGARFDDHDPNTADSGAAYRFRRRGGAWRFEQKLKAADPAAGDELGFAVAVEDMDGQADDLVVAGAYRADSEAGPDSGIARLRIEARNADLEITKSDDRSHAMVGDALVYTITATNRGPADVAGARVTDTFPAGLTCTWTCAPGGAGASCGVASGSGSIDVLVTLAENASVIFTATCTVAASAQCSTIVNRATIAMPDDGIEIDPEDNSATDATRIGMSTLTIDKTAPATIEVTSEQGADLTERVEVSNIGSCPASPVDVTDTRPAGDPRTSCFWACLTEDTCGGASGPGLLGDLVPTLPAGATATYEIDCRVPPGLPSGTMLMDTATASGPDNEVMDKATTTVVLVEDGEPDVSITVVPNPVEAPEIEGRVLIANLGGSLLTDVPVVLALDPAVVDLVTFGPPCETSPSSAICTVPLLGPGAEVQLDLDIPSDCDNPSEVELTARVEPPVDDNPANDQGSGTLALTPPDACPVNLRILKTKTTPPTQQVAQGGVVSFSIAVTNDGPETAFNARVEDPLPPGLLPGASWTCVASAGAICQEEGTGGIVDEVTLPPGGTVTYSLTATVAGNACGPVTNTAFVTALPPNVDTQPLDNTGSASFLAVPANGTCAVKTAAPKAQLEGGEIVFTVLLIHGGPGTLGGPGNEFEDTVPAGLTVIGVSADQGTASFVGNFVTWDGTLDPGESVTITITTTVDPGTLGQILCNQGEVVPNQTLTDEPDEPGNEDPTCVFIVATIPTLSPALLAVMTLLLAALGVVGLARRRSEAAKAKNR